VGSEERGEARKKVEWKEVSERKREGRVSMRK